MSNETMLAAVRAAATDPALAAQPAGQQPEETTMAETKPAAPVTITSVAALTAAYPQLAAELQTQAATGERERILGIERIAVAGHDKLVADCKADASVTPEKAAMRILEAEKLTRGRQATAIADVEKTTSAVKPAAAAQAPAGTQAVAQTPEGWKAEYAASADLQGEFGSEGAYVSYREGEASGRIRILKNRSA